MTDSDKPFVCYKSGWSISIKPRTAAGWRYFGAWMAVFGLITGLLVWLDPEGQTRARYAAIMVGYLLVVSLWAIAMIIWTMARSEVIDMNAPGGPQRGRRK